MFTGKACLHGRAFCVLGATPPVGNFAKIHARGRGGLQKHTWRNLTTPSPGAAQGGPGRGRRRMCGAHGGARGRRRTAGRRRTRAARGVRGAHGGTAQGAGGAGRAGAHGGARGRRREARACGGTRRAYGGWRGARAGVEPTGARGTRRAYGARGGRTTGRRGTRRRGPTGGTRGRPGRRAAGENELLLMRVEPSARPRRIKNNAGTTAFLILLFGPRRVMYMSRAGKRAAAGAYPAGTKRERSTAHEKPNLRHRD